MSNGHVSLNRKDSKGIAMVEVNTLSEDDHHINPADHDGKISKDRIRSTNAENLDENTKFHLLFVEVRFELIRTNH